MAVQGSQDFWEKYGFSIVRKIEGYGEGLAYYMKRDL